MFTNAPWDIENEFQGFPLDHKLLEGRYQVGSRQLAVRYFVVNFMLCMAPKLAPICHSVPFWIDDICSENVNSFIHPGLSPLRGTFIIIYFHFFTYR